MKQNALLVVSVIGLLASFVAAQAAEKEGATLLVPLAASSVGANHRLKLFDISYETRSAGTVRLPRSLTSSWHPGGAFQSQTSMPDGRTILLTSGGAGKGFTLKFSAQPSDRIMRWSFSADCSPDEYFSGVMERLVDGPQRETWKPGRTEALNLRGQSIDMLVKPTLSIYAPFYVSSRGYGLLVKGTWPGHFDFCANNSDRVAIAFEGASLEMKIYTAKTPAEIVQAHALDAGPPILPPKWIYSPWRWRDEPTELTTYYDGTPVTGPFNSEFMEDVLMMNAYGIPNGVYWIDRPWGPGPQGYDDFEIDEHRLPHFADSIQWLNEQGSHMMMWVGPFFQGKMAEEALTRHYNMPDQTVPPTPHGGNYPLADFTSPASKKFWQEGFAKLLKLGVVGFKMDRSEENIPDDGPEKVSDGRSLRENRNAYPVEYLQAAYEVAKKFHPDGDFVLMPRAAYTGSSRYGVF